MKILLFNPPGKAIKVEPLGLEYLASALKGNAFETTLVDATIDGLSVFETLEKLRLLKPDILGMTITTPGLCHDISMLKKVRDILPDVKIIVGGPQPSSDPKGLLKAIPEIDFAVIGEGELTLIEMLSILDRNKDMKGVKGIAWRQSGNIVVNPPRELITELDSISFPSREFINYDKVVATIPFGRRKPFSIMMTSRGCPYNCIYCSRSVYGRGYRMRSVDNVLNEIEHLVSIGIKEIRFYDDIFTINSKRVIAICDELIKRKYDLIWTCESRVNTISKELLIKMKNAGCYNVAYGVESGSQKVLNLAKKGITIDQIKQAYKLTREAGLESGGWFMFGLPGETKETIAETLQLIKEIDADFIAAGQVGLLPKTELYDIALKEGFINTPPWYDFIKERTSPVVDGYWKRYIPAGMTGMELEKALKRFYFYYYFNPKKIYRNIKNVRNFKILFNGFKSLLKYVLYG